MKKAKFWRWFCEHRKESKLNLDARLRVFEAGRTGESFENVKKRHERDGSKVGLRAMFKLY